LLLDSLVGRTVLVLLVGLTVSHVASVAMFHTDRASYQYFTEAKMERLRAAGYHRPFTSLEEAVKQYVEHYLSRPDRYR
jgi:nucleoside-diphosphate-sugar epimerase